MSEDIESLLIQEYKKLSLHIVFVTFSVMVTLKGRQKHDDSVPERIWNSNYQFAFLFVHTVTDNDTIHRRQLIEFIDHQLFTYKGEKDVFAL